MSPVVSLLTDLSVLDSLAPSEREVDVIFDHPLEALLDPPLSAQENLVEIDSELWPSHEQFYVSLDTSVNVLTLFYMVLWIEFHR